MTKYYFRSEIHDTHAYPVEAVAGEGDWEQWDETLYVKAEDAEKMLKVLKFAKVLIEALQIANFGHTLEAEDNSLTLIKQTIQEVEGEE